MKQQLIAWSIAFFTIIQVHISYAQDVSLFNHYYMDKTFYNASYAGEYRNPVIHLTYRQQWAGVTGAPETMMLAGNFNLPKSNLAFAGRVFQDKTGIFQRYGMKLTSAYSVTLDKKKLTNLNFGMSLGFLRNDLDWGRINEQGDEVINDETLYNLDNSFNLDGDFGVHFSYRNKKETTLWDLGFSLPQILNRRLRQETSSVKYLSQSIISTSIEKYFNNKIFANAAILYRIGTITGGQMDFVNRVGMLMNDGSFWASYLYRMDNGSTFGAGLTWKNMGLSFTYDLTSGTIAQYSNGSYEIHLSYFFGNRRTPRIPTRLDIDFAERATTKLKNEADKTQKSAEENNVENNAEENGEVTAEKDSNDTSNSEEINTESTDSEENVEGNKSDEETISEAETSEKNTYKSETYEELSERFKDAKAGKVYVLNNMNFPSNSAQLQNSSYGSLDMLAIYLKNNPNLKVEIGGHTDNKGDERTNLILSRDRAKTVAIYLLKRGVMQDQIVSKGYGKSAPITGNDDEEDRAINRRIEMKILEN